MIAIRDHAGSALSLSGFSPISRPVIQRKCACGETAGRDGECHECCARRERAADYPKQSAMPPLANNWAVRFGHSFGKVGVLSSDLKNSGPGPESGQTDSERFPETEGKNGPPIPAPAPGVFPPTPPPPSAPKPAPPPKPSPKPACPADKQSEKLTACIQPVLIADYKGKNSTKAPSFAESKSIWSKCCVELSVNSAKTVNNVGYLTLDESRTATPSKEEASLFKDAGSSNCIQVFVPVQFTQDGKTGKDISGGGATYDYGKANPKVVVVEGMAGENVAHEVGHALGDGSHTEGTVMEGTGHYNVANLTNVSAEICKKAKTGATLTKAGTSKDCCMRF